MIIRAVYNMQINTSTQLKSIAVQTKHAAVMYVQQNGRKNQQHRLCGGVQPLRECVSVTLKKKNKMRIADVLFHRPAWTDDQTRVVLIPNGDLKARKRWGETMQ